MTSVRTSRCRAPGVSADRHPLSRGRGFASARMTAMRVYLGSDHAGFELKQAIIEHLRNTGHEPIDCGAYTYDAEDDYPAFCIAAAEKTVADPESLGIVIGGSGNGEQIAANKVPGVRCALAWSVETATLAREHNNAQVMGIGGRMHTVEHALEIIDAFLGAQWSKAERHQRRIDILSEYERPTSRRPCPAPPPRDARRPHAAPAGPAASAPVRPRAGDGVQPAGQVRRRRRRGQRPGPQEGQRLGQAPVPPLRGRPRGARAPGSVRHVHRGADPDAAAGRPGADADDRRRIRHRPARADGVRGDRGARDRRRGSQTRAGPVATRRRRCDWPGRESASRAGRLARC